MSRARSDRLLLACALLAAVALHLPAHVGWSGGPAGRTPLYEDGPALVSNPAFERRGTERHRDVILRAATDPAAQWDDPGGAVARERWRPVSTVAAAVERIAGRGSAARVAAAVSLLLHLSVVALTLRLLAALDAPRAARWIGTVAVAVSPAALAAAAWPARQSIVLATALSLGGVLAGLRGGARRGVLAGLLLAAGSLAHEFAFAGWFALAVLRLRSAPPAARARPALVASALPVAGAVALWAWRMAAAGRGAAEAAAPLAQGAPPSPQDGAVGVLHTLVSAALPARLHFADGPWTAAGTGVVVSLLAVAALAVLWIRRSGGPSDLALASLAAASPLLTVGIGGVRAGAPFHDGALYAVSPFAFSALAWAIAGAVRRGGALRVAAAVAGALWIGALVAGTARRAPAFRTKEAHAELAKLEMLRSPVAEAWSLDVAVSAAAAAGGDAPAELRRLAPRIREFGESLAAPEAVPLRGDAVATLSVATALSRAGAEFLRAGVPPGDVAYEDVERGCAAATDVLPGSVTGWLVLSEIRDAAGMLRAAHDAVLSAAALAPDRLDVLERGVGAALALGRVGLAAELADRLLRGEIAESRASGRPPRARVVLLFARATAADGTSFAAPPEGGGGMRLRYEPAIAVLQEMIARNEMPEDARAELYRVALRYGDVLATLDRTLLARSAYQVALGTGVRDPEAREHLQWLEERLREEEKAAGRALADAERGKGSVADAYLDLAKTYARQGRLGDADEMFRNLESRVGMSPALRANRAILLLRETEPRRAIDELRLALEEDPTMAQARFELGRLLQEYEGDLPRAREAFDESMASALKGDGPVGEWVLDAEARSLEIERVLGQDR